MKNEITFGKWLFKKLINAGSNGIYITSTELISDSEFPLTDIKASTAGVRIRKEINLMRNKNIPVLASNRGYMVKWDRDLIIEQIVSMENRIKAEQSALFGLKSVLGEIDKVEEIDFFKEGL
jgi:hypothetical protein